MPKLFATRRGLILTLIVAFLLIAAGVFLAIWSATFFWPYVITLAVTIALWFGLEWFMKARARRKQAAFDAAVAAKEGIDDRRREWESWTNELKKQGIDRHSLPFYLLLGEPQSGKSVLLHNSDLHFPFGQNRLSGVGGTRGCDWWFTEEAVILDLAGRLFTHEGGASDEAEWQAFLDLLSSFRPMCPANGVLLVLPCDGLLNDSPQQASLKASRMQAALLTLVQRLQVQLPVYVVLTKGDKVFGFAESVHRLETEKRHEMFGWSRPSEKVEVPFSIDEAREGFASLLARCRALRAGMLGSARIPEALGEVDRLYAFPDEFAQVLPNFEVYLRKIFTDSALVERLFFRGFYLTSGLQTGAPIVKACAALLGGAGGVAGEADARNLESLFAKQRAYFIKDLVRKRLFEERGVVRPTKKRAVMAKRNAFIGYGAGGLVTVATLIAIANYLPASKQDLDFFMKAKDQAVTALKREPGAAPAALPDLLASLEKFAQAADKERPFLERMLPFGVGSSRDEFQRAYVAFFDGTVPAALRRAAEKQVRADVETPPANHAEFLKELEAANRLRRPIPWQDAEQLAAFAGMVAPQERVATGAAAQGGFDLVAATKLRLEYDDDAPIPPMGAGALDPSGNGQPTRELDEIVATVKGRLDSAFDFRDPAHVNGELGKFAAWAQAREVFTRLTSNPSAYGPTSKGTTAQDDGELYRILMQVVCGPDYARRGPGAPLPTAKGTLLADLDQLCELRDELVAGDATAPPSYAPAEVVREQSHRLFLGSAGATPKDRAGALKALAGAAAAELGVKNVELALPHEGKNGDESSAFLAICDPNVLAVAPTLDVAKLPGAIKDVRTRWLTDAMKAGPVGSLVLSKLFGADRKYVATFDPASDAAALESLCTALNAGKLPDFAPPVLGHLVDLRMELAATDKARFTDWIRALDDLLLKYLNRLDRSFAVAVATDPYLDAVAASALKRASDGSIFDAPVAKAGDDVRRAYLEATREATLRWWRGERAADEATAASHLARLFASLRYANTEFPKELTATTSHSDWLKSLDQLVSARLRAHRDRLFANWSLGDPAYFDFGTLKEVARRASDLVSEAQWNERRQKVRDSALRRTVDELAEPEKIEPRLNATLPELKKLGAALAPPETTTLADSTHARWLREFAVKIDAVDAQERESRHKFAREWADVPAERRTQPEDPTADVARCYVASVVASLDRRLLRELRGFFEQEFGRGFLGSNDRPTWEGLILARRGGGGLDEGMSTLAGWLDRKGALDQIADHYQLRRKERTIHPVASELADLSRLAWDAFDFLDQLQAFLLPAEKTAIKEATIRYTLTLDLDAQGSVWWPKDATTTRVNWFGVVQRAGAPPDDFFVDQALRANPGKASKVFTWSCAPGVSPALTLGWNNAFEMPASALADATHESYLQQFPGPLGLLAFVWAGEPREGDANADWKVTVKLAAPGAAANAPALSAPFKLHFDAPLPRRPRSLEQHDWSR